MTAVPSVPSHSSARWPDAALGGVASSMRTFAVPATLAARGAIAGKPRAGMLALAAAELTVDKLPQATDRTDPPGLVARIATGAYGGWGIAGPAGVVTGAVAAAGGTYATWRIRKLVVKTTGLPDPAVAVAEDVLTFTAAAIATRPAPPVDEEEPPRPSLLKSAAHGAIAGAVGTAAMTLAQGAEFVLTDAKPSSAPADVAQKILKQVGRGRIKRKHRAAVNQGMHWGYGISWGVPYGIVAAGSRAKPELTGPAFGLAVWAMALGHQPALGLGEVPWKRSLQSLSSEAFFHVVYGVGAAAGLRALRNRR